MENARENTRYGDELSVRLPSVDVQPAYNASQALIEAAFSYTRSVFKENTLFLQELVEVKSIEQGFEIQLSHWRIQVEAWLDCQEKVAGLLLSRAAA